MAGYVSSMNADHQSPVRTDRHSVRCSSRDDGHNVFVTVEYAVSRLEGYWKDDPEGWIEATLRHGQPLQTISFVYVIDPEVQDVRS